MKQGDLGDGAPLVAALGTFRLLLGQGLGAGARTREELDMGAVDPIGATVVEPLGEVFVKAVDPDVGGEGRSALLELLGQVASADLQQRLNPAD